MVHPDLLDQPLRVDLAHEWLRLSHCDRPNPSYPSGTHTRCLASLDPTKNHGVPPPLRALQHPIGRHASLQPQSAPLARDIDWHQRDESGKQTRQSENPGRRSWAMLNAQRMLLPTLRLTSPHGTAYARCTPAGTTAQHRYIGDGYIHGEEDQAARYLDLFGSTPPVISVRLASHQEAYHVHHVRTTNTRCTHCHAG